MAEDKTQIIAINLGVKTEAEVTVPHTKDTITFKVSKPENLVGTVFCKRQLQVIDETAMSLLDKTETVFSSNKCEMNLNITKLRNKILICFWQRTKRTHINFLKSR